MSTPLLLTTAAHASAKHTALTDTQSRIDAFAWSLEQWCKSESINQIVICDGSNYNFSAIANAVNRSNKKIECLHFHNDAQKVAQQGKGYGEGQIVEFALRNSELLNSSQTFAKCTGRLWVKNHALCLKLFKKPASFNLIGRRRVSFVDTRFYIADKKFYEEKLVKAHLKVDDDNGYYLEHSFADCLKGFNTRSLTFTCPPVIKGTSGSTGQVYNPTPSEFFRAGLRCLSQIIRPKPVGNF